MNRLVIIGNGFDMAHGLKTSYVDFINWYWEQRLFALLTENTAVSKDCLCELKIINTQECSNWLTFFFTHSLRDPLNGNWKYSPSEIIGSIKENTDDFSVSYSTFFEGILQSIETKGWVDIENDYYQLLKQCIDKEDFDLAVSELNIQLRFLQDKLVDYLGTIDDIRCRKDIHDSIIDFFNPADFSTEGRNKAIDSIGLDIKDIEEVQYKVEERNKLIPEHIMLLSFNYTATARVYDNFNLSHNYIHGELSKPANIIFGYGDELDKSYQDILDKNNNELLRNVKSVKYLETRRYREMLESMFKATRQHLGSTFLPYYAA